MSYVIRKRGTFDEFQHADRIAHDGEDQWASLSETYIWTADPSVYREVYLGTDGEVVEFTTAKRELEEHLLREKLLAVKTERPTEPVDVPEFHVRPAIERTWSAPGTGMVFRHVEGSSTAYLAGINTEATKAQVLALRQVLGEIAAGMP